MERPFFSMSVGDLEAQFDERLEEKDFLESLAQELGHRSTPRAKRLQKRVAEQLTGLRGANSSPDISSTDRPAPPVIFPLENNPSSTPKRAAHAAPLPPVTNQPEAVLSAWTALEVLSPISFDKPEKLAPGKDSEAIAKIDGDALPWENGGIKAPPGKLRYYQIVLGSVEMEPAMTELLKTFSDSRPERTPKQGEAILAVIVVDRKGCLAGDQAVAVSSFGWGLPRALEGDLASLADWPAMEKTLVAGLRHCLNPDEGAEERMLTRAALARAFQWLVAAIRMPQNLIKPPRFAVRYDKSFKNPTPPDPLLLNSFYFNDLALARSLFASGQAPASLRYYLGAAAPAERKNLLNHQAALEAAIAPKAMPVSRWPGKGRHPLVLLQQAAVNLALSELAHSGMLAVNGPPGTGKTTLLRDLVAALVSSRAEIMATFSDPTEAFCETGERLGSGQERFDLHSLDDRLKGFEMLVASSNNKAVENVSEELPKLNVVADDFPELRYFSTLSDALVDGQSWGVIAAVLGNSANRWEFTQKFWRDDETGLDTYLAQASGTPQFVEAVDPLTQEKITRPPRIVQVEQPPENHAAALVRWQEARRRFKEATRASRQALAALEKIREDARRLPDLMARVEKTVGELKESEVRVWQASDHERMVRGKAEDAAMELRRAEQSLAEQLGQKPGFWARLFRTKSALDWREGHRRRLAAVDSAQQGYAAAARQAESGVKLEREARARQVEAGRVAQKAAAECSTARNEVEAARLRLGKHFVGEGFFAQHHGERHLAVPWLDDETQRLRDEAFVAAIALQRAFVDAAAKPLLNNLGALMKVLSGGSLSTPEKQRLLPDLWSSLFLVVPVVSTTFASVDRMLGALPPESLGWLLVDEAGQALPQAAIGAIIRTKRAVVVGDPVQIEPVVSLPESLTRLICRRFGVAPERFNAPEASVQTLADAATPYCAEFKGRHGCRTVGVPLLVHRRCSEPMFGIANHVAYERLMVQAKKAQTSAIRDALGESCWIHVEGEAVDKWCAEEGEVVLLLLRRLAEKGINPDLYIVTPFVTVAENLRRALLKNRVLESWVTKPWEIEPWNWVNERVGTVHTVQGREAEAVIFVLGAPLAEQGGARAWAGGRPNLLNVAVSRAKEVIYVVGNRRLWSEAGFFRELDVRI